MLFALAREDPTHAMACQIEMNKSATVERIFELCLLPGKSYSAVHFMQGTVTLVNLWLVTRQGSSKQFQVTWSSQVSFSILSFQRFCIYWKKGDFFFLE